MTAPPRRALPCQARRAFTLIELLVVIAIIGVLIALLLPAVQAAREAARRVQCTNNLSQIGLALQNYQNSFEVLPPGVVDTAGPILDQPKGYHFGWVARMLPYIEQRPVYANLNFQVSVYDAVNTTATVIPIGTLLCPSDYSGRNATTGAAQTNYVGCHNPIEAPIDVTNRGLLFLNSAIRTEDIPDGASSTILVSEKLLEDDLGWASGTRATLRNTGDPPNKRATTPLGFAPAPPVTPNPPNFVGGFSSRHSGGVNIALADGSVRFLKDSVTPEIVHALGGRNDGEMIGSDKW